MKDFETTDCILKLYENGYWVLHDDTGSKHWFSYRNRISPDKKLVRQFFGVNLYPITKHVTVAYRYDSEWAWEHGNSLPAPIENVVDSFFGNLITSRKLFIEGSCDDGELDVKRAYLVNDGHFQRSVLDEIKGMISERDYEFLWLQE
ncbi:MAG: hypothetical protein NTZ35_01345 [Ignavibacteriales bacterium]|nr:hypothetical protein [Ignavibacteriales bacterium]